MTAMPDWRPDVLPLLAGNPAGEPNYRQQDGIICREGLHVEVENSLVWQESAFLERASVTFSTTYLETLQLKAIIDQALETAGTGQGTPIFDVGCSDGRITRHLLSAGYRRVVSCDIEFEPLYRFHRQLSEDEKARTLLLVDDVNAIPFRKGAFDFIIAWGIVSQTPDPNGTFQNLLSLLSDTGVMLFAEPLLEQALIYALVRSDPQEFLRALSSSTRPRSWEEQDVRYKVLPLQHYRQWLEGFPVKILDQGGISMLPSLAVGGLFQDSPLDEGAKSEWIDVLSSEQARGLEVYRQHYWVLAKS